MKSLFGDPVVQAALLMIDWGSRRIPLYPDRQAESERSVRLTNEVVAAALMFHDERPEGFSDVESDIRAAFDRFLDGLERFHSYVETGLVKLDDLRPYLSYWARNICRPRTPRPADHRVVRLKQYMQRYGFDNALNLLERIAAEQADAPRPAAPSS
jgi:hypothetical protein